MDDTKRTNTEGSAVPDFTQIAYDVADSIATITLNRPDAMNAFTERMRVEMMKALDRSDADDNVRAVIITGQGDRVFCAGADLAKGGDTFSGGGSTQQTDVGVPRDGGGMVSLRIFDSLKPIIGAFNGAAVGVGITMMLPVDVRIAADHARFGFVFNRRGILPEAASSWFLPRVVGMSQALQWAYSGRVFPAAEALEGGLISEIVPASNLVARARQLAHELTDHSAPVSVAITRQMMWRMLGAEHPMRAHEVDSRGILARGQSADAVEGVTSFLEKRDADFPNRVSADMPDLYPNWDEPKFK